MTYHEHHYRNLERARDHLTETIVSLSSAADRMMGDDWIDAVDLLNELTENIGPRLARLRNAASKRFDEHARLEDFHLMRTGEMLFPDERAPAIIAPVAASTAVAAAPPLNAPNAKEGARLVDEHGGVDAAMMAYQPDSAEFDHIQAFRYLASRERPQGWVPPIVSADE